MAKYPKYTFESKEVLNEEETKKYAHFNLVVLPLVELDTNYRKSSSNYTKIVYL